MTTMCCTTMRNAGLAAAFVALWAGSAAAQNWEFDARRIALGGAGSSNLASDMIEEQRPYRAIVLPFGLFQVLRDFDIYDPSSNRFDPVRAIEHAASPIHYIVNRDSTATGGEQAFVSSIRNGVLSRDLNIYRGFAPAPHIETGGLTAPNWGGTISLAKTATATHGLYVGAGPYLSLRTTNDIDPRLASLLAGSSPTVIPNAQLPLSNASQAQGAVAVTGGYRGRFAFDAGSGGALSRDGLYVALNYSYLIGLLYQDTDLRLRLDTDAAGLVTLVPTSTPLAISRQSSTSGRGSAIDLGVGAIVGPLAVGFGANGIANHITWTGATRTSYTLPNLLTGGSFLESPELPIGDLRVELPIDYRGSVSYDAGSWLVMSEGGHGLGGTNFHGGLEYRGLGEVELRGGIRYSFEQWNPTGGVGFNLGNRVALDVAAYGTSANIERKRLLAIAASIRIKQKRD